MSAQLLLNKHRHSKKPTGAKSQEVHHKGIYNQKTLIGYQVFILFEIYLQAQNLKRYKSFVSGQQRKGRKNRKIHPSLARKRNEIHTNLPKSDKSLANRHEAKLLVQISHL